MASTQATKVCRKCASDLPLSAFHKQTKKSPDGLQRWCRDCSNKYRRDLYRKSDSYRSMVNKRNRRLYYEDRPTYLRRARKCEIKRKYGLSIEQHDELLAAQGGRCALCQSAEPRGHGSWHVDHDHNRNVMRGLLCHCCNTTLGIYEKLKRTPGFRKIEQYLQGNPLDAMVPIRCREAYPKSELSNEEPSLVEYGQQCSGG